MGCECSKTVASPATATATPSSMGSTRSKSFEQRTPRRSPSGNGNLTSVAPTDYSAAGFRGEEDGDRFPDRSEVGEERTKRRTSNNKRSSKSSGSKKDLLPRSGSGTGSGGSPASTGSSPGLPDGSVTKASLSAPPTEELEERAQRSRDETKKRHSNKSKRERGKSGSKLSEKVEDTSGSAPAVRNPLRYQTSDLSPRGKNRRGEKSSSDDDEDPELLSDDDADEKIRADREDAKKRKGRQARPTKRQNPLLAVPEPDDPETPRRSSIIGTPSSRTTSRSGTPSSYHNAHRSDSSQSNTPVSYSPNGSVVAESYSSTTAHRRASALLSAADKLADVIVSASVAGRQHSAQLDVTDDEIETTVLGRRGSISSGSRRPSAASSGPQTFTTIHSPPRVRTTEVPLYQGGGPGSSRRSTKADTSSNQPALEDGISGPIGMVVSSPAHHTAQENFSEDDDHEVYQCRVVHAIGNGAEDSTMSTAYASSSSGPTLVDELDPTADQDQLSPTGPPTTTYPVSVWK